MKVADLVIPMREWDVELVDDIFQTRYAKLIKEVPLSRGGENKLIWHFSKDWIYQVQSGYRVVLDECANIGNHRSEGKWVRLWNLHMPSII
ncbi:hypothetical protein Syun_006889 [Stephania yunnanensis]|uniref:Uncharacterized protein n=1 Tax=Stephania yunnanensis TaxID=152371 RepID=A0AAP0KYX1_9MAGN